MVKFLPVWIVATVLTLGAALAQPGPPPPYNAPASGYKQHGSTILTQTNGVGSPDVCTVNCDLLIGTNAGFNLNSADYLTTAVGWEAMYNSTQTNTESTCVGYKCEYSVITGNQNTGVGINFLGNPNNTTGNNSSDIGLGTDVMRNAYTGASHNIGIGVTALINTADTNDVAIGDSVLAGNTSAATTGTNNIGIGFNATGALGNATSAQSDIGLGTFALRAVTSGGNNVAMGYEAGYQLTTGGANVLIGTSTGQALTGNGNDTILGYNAGHGVTGSANTIIGSQVGSSTLTSGSNNILIGDTNAVDTPVAASSDNLVIGNVIAGTESHATNPAVCAVGMPCVIGVLRSANLNVTTDQAVTIAPLTSSAQGYLKAATKYIVTGMFVTNCSTTATTAAGGLYDAASKGGNALIAAAQTYANCTSSATMQTATLASIAQSTVETGGSLYFSLTTGHGSAATGDVYVLGIPFD